MRLRARAKTAMKMATLRRNWRVRAGWPKLSAVSNWSAAAAISPTTAMRRTRKMLSMSLLPCIFLRNMTAMTISTTGSRMMAKEASRAPSTASEVS